MLLLLSTLALALDSTHIVSVGEEITPDFAGSWVRLFPNASDPGSWHFLFGAGGDYNLLPMTADLEVRDALAVEAAATAGCGRLLTEALPHGTVLRGLVVEDPANWEEYGSQ